MDLEKIGVNAGNWVDSAQDRDYWRALVKYIILRWARHIVRMGEDGNAFKILTDKVIGRYCLVGLEVCMSDSRSREVMGSTLGTSTILNVD